MRWAARPLVLDLVSGRVGEQRAAEVMDHSTVMAPLLWVARTFPEAPVEVRRVMPDGIQTEMIPDHPLTVLMRRPNPAYPGVVLWTATVIDYQASGNAYWLTIRDRARRVTELWWAPAWMMRPAGDPTDDSVFISHYEYRPGGGVVWEIPPSDVVHFRFGMDPKNPRCGLSPLASVLREVWTDDQAAVFTATLMQNMGVPGMVIAPADPSGTMNQEQADAAKRYVQSHFTGDRRGEALVLGTPVSVNQFGFSPDQLDLRGLRRVPEERVSAVMGVPAVVAGLGAGLDRSTFTNMAEAREMAYESNIIPTQRSIAAQLEHQLLPELVSTSDTERVAFDLTGVRVLQEDRLRQVQRATASLLAGGITLGEFRRDIGLVAAAEHDVFYRPVNVTPVPATPAGLAGGDQTGRDDVELRALLALAASRAGLAMQYGAVDQGFVDAVTAAPANNGSGGGAGA